MTSKSTQKYTVAVAETVDVSAPDPENALREVSRVTGISQQRLSIEGVDDLEEIDGPTAELLFTPQQWIRGRAEQVETDGKQSWLVPLEDAVTEDGHLIKPTDFESDDLKDHDRAPLWVKKWSGPFSIKITDICGIPSDLKELLCEGEPIDEVLQE
jgi:hypothetical protein